MTQFPLYLSRNSKEASILNSFWWADCAMRIHLHLYKLAVTPGGLSLLLKGNLSRPDKHVFVL